VFTAPHQEIFYYLRGTKRCVTIFVCGTSPRISFTIISCVWPAQRDALAAQRDVLLSLFIALHKEMFYYPNGAAPIDIILFLSFTIIFVWCEDAKMRRSSSSIRQSDLRTRDVIIFACEDCEGLRTFALDKNVSQGSPILEHWNTEYA
jgi:hypothetical protein